LILLPCLWICPKDAKILRFAQDDRQDHCTVYLPRGSSKLLMMPGIGELIAKP
jgi:hypothetical protein